MQRCAAVRSGSSSVVVLRAGGPVTDVFVTRIRDLIDSGTVIESLLDLFLFLQRIGSGTKTLSTMIDGNARPQSTTALFVIDGPPIPPRPRASPRPRSHKTQLPGEVDRAPSRSITVALRRRCLNYRWWRLRTRWRRASANVVKSAICSTAVTAPVRICCGARLPLHHPPITTRNYVLLIEEAELLANPASTRWVDRMVSMN